MGLQLRLAVCHLAGVAATVAAMPYLLAAGIRVDRIVVASVLGLLAFLLVAAVAGLLLRRAIARRPFLAALAAPPALAAAIYLILRSLDGFAADGAPLALEAALIGGLAASFSSAFQLVWGLAAPLARESA